MSKNQSKSKHSRIATAAINPCNQFLVHYLLKQRQKEGTSRMMKAKSRNDHQFHLYSRAIDSIRKYPLPIICADQLALLAGLGDWLIGKLTNVIKDHYKRFLRPDHESAENKHINTGVCSQVKKQDKEGRKFLNWMSECSSVKSQNQVDPEQQEYQSQKNDKIHPLTIKAGSDYDNRSIKSDNIGKKNNNYKPRQGSQAANIVKVLKILNAGMNSATKKDIEKCLMENNYDKIKQWKSCKDNLLKNGYLEVDHSVDYEAYFLTEKAQEYLNENQQQETSNLTKKKMQSQISSFKQKFMEKEREKEQAAISQAISMGTQYSYSQSNSRTYRNQAFVFRKRLQKNPQQRLIIIIDTRQMKDQSEKTYFQETLAEKYGIDVITHALTIGDFAFCYNGDVLDYIIERKKADDLSSSIIDGRYKEQKYRLKNCGASNILYFYEGHPSETSVLKQKELMNALQKTRVTDGFKVYKTARTTETVKLLATLHKQIQTRIDNGQQLMTIGTIQQFNHRNTKNRYLTVETVFGLGLKSFPNVGKQTVTNILRYFKSYYLLYTQLQKYGSNAQRIQFLNGLLKGGRTQAGVTTLIVELLFGMQNKKQEIASQQLSVFMETL